MSKLIRNRIQCRKCKDIIESVHRHDFKYCKCGEVFIDGGKDYQRAGGKSLLSIVDMSVFEDDICDGGDEE